MCPCRNLFSSLCQQTLMRTLTFLCFVPTGVSHRTSNSEVHILQIWVPAGEVRYTHIPPTDEFQCLFMLIKWTSLNVLLCLLFTVKPIQSARNVPRMSNSLEPWVTPLLPDKPFTFIHWFKLHTSHVSVALSSRLKMPILRCVGIGFLSNSYWKLIEGLQISGISNCC